jgi:hypothetical protein
VWVINLTPTTLHFARRSGPQSSTLHEVTRGAGWFLILDARGRRRRLASNFSAERDRRESITENKKPETHEAAPA